MSARTRTRTWTAAAAVGLLWAAFPSAPALAAGGRDDEPIPYDDEDTSTDTTYRPRERPRRSEPTRIAPEETDVEKEDRERSLADWDDPSTGIAGELLSGAMLLDSSRGALVEGRFMWGLRFTWEVGRALPGTFFRESLFADFTWSYVGMRDGTAVVYGDSNYHYFTVAPAWGLQLWRDSDYSVFFQAGGGLAYQLSALHNGTSELTVAGVKPLIQYGVGLRGRPLVLEDVGLRVSFRVEVTRFRRQYMDDTFVGGSAGVAY